LSRNGYPIYFMTLLLAGRERPERPERLFRR